MYEEPSIGHEKVSRAEVENRAAVLMKKKKSDLQTVPVFLEAIPLNCPRNESESGDLYRHALKTGSAPGR